MSYIIYMIIYHIIYISLIILIIYHVFITDFLKNEVQKGDMTYLKSYNQILVSLDHKPLLH